MKRQPTDLFRSFLTVALMTVLTLGLIGTPATAAPVGENLLRNPGFESYLVVGWGDDVHPPWGRGQSEFRPGAL